MGKDIFYLYIITLKLTTQNTVYKCIGGRTTDKLDKGP